MFFSKLTKISLFWGLFVIRFQGVTDLLSGSASETITFSSKWYQCEKLAPLTVYSLLLFKEKLHFRKCFLEKVNLNCFFLVVYICLLQTWQYVSWQVCIISLLFRCIYYLPLCAICELLVTGTKYYNTNISQTKI